MSEVREVSVQELRRIVGDNENVIAIYLTQYTMLKGLMHLARKLSSSGYQVLFLIEVNLISYIKENPGFVYAIQKGDVELIEFVKVFITLRDATHYSDQVRLPQKPILVACGHSFLYIEPMSDVEPYSSGMLRIAYEFDYYIQDAARLTQVSPQWIEEAAKKQFPHGAKLRAKNTFSFLPAGYLNYDATVEYFERVEEKPYALFYCHQRGDGRWRLEREKIVSTLLESFPELTTIYSAGPFEWMYPDRFEMIEQFTQHPRFELGRDRVNLIPFAKALICITSDSDTVLTFGVSTLRPFVRCNFTWEGSPDAPPIRWHDFGCDVFSREQLRTAVGELLQAMASSDGPIIDRREYEAYTPNLGRACDKFLEYLPYILRGEEHPEWITYRIPETLTGTGLDRTPVLPGIKKYPIIPTPPALALEMRYDSDLPRLPFRSLSLEEIDYVFQPDGPRFMIWGGSGNYRDNFRDKLLGTRNNFLGFIERDKHILEHGLDGYSAYSSSAIPDIRPDFIFVSTAYHSEVVTELLGVLGVE